MKQITQNLRWLLTLLAMIVSIGAWATDGTITLTYDSFGLTSSYSKKTATVNGIGFTVDQGYKGSGNVIQMNSTKGSGILYNTTAIIGLKSITVNVASGNKTYTITTGTSEKPTTNNQTGTTTTTFDVSNNDTYFQLKVSGASYFSSIVITYDENIVATPAITPNGGSIYTTDDITITCGTSGASIYYTIDGSTPTINSTAYTDPFTLSSDATVKAIAVKAGMTNSGVATATFTVTEPPTTTTFTHYSGNLTEGDYIIYYDGRAMNTTVSSDRLQYILVTPSNDKITTDDASIIWHIAPSGNYWTIYNAKEGKYAASTGAANKAQLLSSGTDDKSLWTIEGNSTYEFRNKYNSDKSLSSLLRNNGTYGFACYSNSTGGKLSLYKKETNVATPTFLPAGGTFIGTQSVVISCETEGATIYYTMDGSDPTSESTPYTGTITISATTTVKAIAIKGNETSNISSATYEKVIPSAGLEYSESSAEVTFNETPYTLPTLNNPYSVSVTYSSSNEAVATVNLTTGQVTICGAGTTTITATFSGNDDYQPGSASYTLTVNPMNSTEIDLVNNESVTFTNGSWTSVATSYPNGEAENQFIGSDGTSTIWNYKKVLKSTNELQFKSSEGQLSSPKVNCLDGYGYKVTIIFTSGSSSPSGSLYVTASTGEAASMAAPSSGVDVSLSLDVCGWSNVTISNKCTNALYVKEIKFERIEVETVNITISDKAKIDNDYYATFSNSETALHFGAVKGLKAYTVQTAEKESSAITLSEVTKVPANTGLLVCGTTPKTYKVPVIPSTSADEILVNMLHPSTGMTGDGKSVFILANGNKGLGFYIVKNGSSLNSNQAYLKIDNGTSSEIKTFFSLGGDYINDINQIKTESLSENIVFYNLNGQRVAAPLKGGIYIMNGKKVFISTK